MNTYPATFPGGVNPTDIEYAGLSALPSPPDRWWFTSTQFVVVYDSLVLTSPQLVAYEQAVLNAAVNPNNPVRAAATKAATLESAIPTLRSWAADAQSTTVTAGNAVAVLQVVVNRMGIFFDRFADLLELSKR